MISPSAAGRAEGAGGADSGGDRPSPPEPRAKIPLREQADAAHRELVMRHRVYPGLVRRGRMTEAEAAVEMDLMRAIRDTLRLFAEYEDAVRKAIVDAKRRADFERQLEELEQHPAMAAVRETFPGAEVVDVRIINQGGPHV